MLDGLREAVNRDKNGDGSKYSNGTNGWNLRRLFLRWGEGGILGFEITKSRAKGRPTMRQVPG